jgi:dienelactone hydrolase family protein
VLPRSLVIGYGMYPQTPDKPDKISGKEASAAPGGLAKPDLSEVRAEVQRTRGLMQNHFDKNLRLVVADEADSSLFPAEAHAWFSKALNLTNHPALATYRTMEKSLPDPAARQERTVREMERYTQGLLQSCEDERNAQFWKPLPLLSTDKYVEATQPLRETFWNDIIGRLPDPSLPANPRSRLLFEKESFSAYEVILDVWPDVEAWGYLLVPKDLKPGEKRPVVVCQHGLEGLPEDVIAEDEKHPAWHYYKGFAAKLARQGFITFAPHNFYRGKDSFRVIQRKLNPLGQTLFSVIIGQHQRLLEWLKAQPFVDEKRIAFYGLSYGGKSAMRIPAVLEGYCLSICSGDFNEWVRKNMDDAHRLSYLYHSEYEIFEWDLGPTFNYAEMAALIAPRPFMVERGHDDGVGIDEWVSWEYSKVRRLYDKLGIGDRTQIEFFNGPHTIHGIGTFEFLHRELGWPKEP